MAKLTLAAHQAAEIEAARDVAHGGFMIHLVVTALVSIVVVAVNVWVASEFPWSVFPVVGMSIGVFVHWYFGVVHGDRTLREHQSRIERRVA